jgi:hypothetical protein
MANTYTQIYIHIVFAVQGRQNLIRREHSTVIRYIENQQEHHRRKSFSEEYVELLKRLNVPHHQRYIFQPVDPD